MIHGIHGYPVTAAAICGAVGMLTWAYGKAARITAWAFGLAAFFAAIGITAWLDALAGLTSRGGGLAVFALVLTASGFAFYYEVIRKHKHHRIRTPVVAGIFGTAVVVAIGSISSLTASAGKTPVKAGQALGIAVTQIRSGKAAAAMPPGHQTTVLVMGLAIIGALVFAAVSFERRGKGGRGIAGARPGLPAGGRRPAALPGRKR